MKDIKMTQFGTTLIGRADGKKAFQEILKKTVFLWRLIS